MAKAPASSKSQPPRPPLPDASYPQIEGFIEQSGEGDISALFDPLKESLTGLKGPRAEHAKKVKKAIERTEALLAHLLEVREKLRGSGAGPAKARR